MEIGVLLFVIADVQKYLSAKNLLQVDGKILHPSIENDADLLAVIENSLREHGVAIDSKIDNVIRMIPLVLSLSGIK
jgi:hypothetical protein